MSILQTPTPVLVNIFGYLDAISYARLSASHRILYIDADRASIHTITAQDFTKIPGPDQGLVKPDKGTSILRWTVNTQVLVISRRFIPTTLCAFPNLKQLSLDLYNIDCRYSIAKLERLEALHINPSPLFRRHISHKLAAFFYVLRNMPSLKSIVLLLDERWPIPFLPDIGITVETRYTSRTS